MKKIIFALLFTIISLSMEAQPQQQRRGGGAQGSPQEFQIALITKQLRLTEEQGEKFKVLYSQYTADMAKLRVRPERGTAELTDDQIESQILDSFDKADQNNTLKREYYAQFKEIMSPRQILKMYNIEREFQERLNVEHNRRREGN